MRRLYEKRLGAISGCSRYMWVVEFIWLWIWTLLDLGQPKIVLDMVHNYLIEFAAQDMEAANSLSGCKRRGVEFLEELKTHLSMIPSHGSQYHMEPPCTPGEHTPSQCPPPAPSPSYPAAGQMGRQRLVPRDIGCREWPGMRNKEGPAFKHASLFHFPGLTFQGPNGL